MTADNLYRDVCPVTCNRRAASVPAELAVEAPAQREIVKYIQKMNRPHYHDNRNESKHWVTLFFDGLANK